MEIIEAVKNDHGSVKAFIQQGEPLRGAQPLSSLFPLPLSREGGQGDRSPQLPPQTKKRGFKPLFFITE